MVPGRGSQGCPLAQLFLGLTLVFCSTTAPPLPATDDLQVALYFVGEPRTLNATICSILDNIVRPLLASKCRLTFFVYTPRSPGVEQYDLLAAVLRVPVVLRVVDRPPLPPPACVEQLDRRVHVVHRGYNAELLAHIRDMEAVDQERRAYERDHSIQFQWVVFARPDVTYVDPLPPLRRLSPSQLYIPAWGDFGGINDRFAIVPRLYTTPYFHLYSALCAEGPAKSVPFSAKNPERIYRWQLNREHVPLAVIHNFYFVRTRTFQTSHGHFSERDLSLLVFSRCLSAYQYRCCSAARAASPPPAPAGCPKAIHSGRRACAKFEKSATHKAVATRRFGVHLSRSAKTLPANKSVHP
eukprot:EG_transcript_7384